MSFHFAITHSFITNTTLVAPKYSLVVTFGQNFSSEIETTCFTVYVDQNGVTFRPVDYSLEGLDHLMLFYGYTVYYRKQQIICIIPSGRRCILNFICLARSSNSSVIWSLVDLFGGICGSCRFLGDGVPEGCRNPLRK